MHEDHFPMDFVASLPSFGILGVASHESASVEAAHPCGRCALSMAMVSMCNWSKMSKHLFHRHKTQA